MFSGLPYPPLDYHICPCCGTEFGNDDEDFSHSQLREMWLGSGANWFFGNPPAGWNWVLQLYEAGLFAVNVSGIEAEIQAEATETDPAILRKGSFEYSFAVGRG
jgi:hypothetical protein